MLAEFTAKIIGHNILTDGGYLSFNLKPSNKIRFKNMNFVTTDGKDYSTPSPGDSFTNPTQVKTSDVLLDGEVIGMFKKRIDLENFGYFLNGKTEGGRLTNFLVELDKQVYVESENKPQTFFSGHVKFYDGETIEFKRLNGNDLASHQGLINFLTNLCGTKIAFYGSNKNIVEAIKTFNRDIDSQKAEEFGFSEDLSEYLTGNMIISADELTEIETPIHHTEVLQRNKLGFETCCEEELFSMRHSIISDLLTWDNIERTASALSFAMLPLIFPYMEGSVDEKPYLMLKGPSGCGKTLLSNLNQCFYGDFKNLTSWSATTTAISVTGNAYKDCLFVVDDFKKQNFPNDQKVKEVMILLQNYSDQTSKGRSNISLTLRDEKRIKGFLMISAEDLVVTEASTVARGIIINMESKTPNFDGENRLKNNSKQFKKFTAYYIQHILKNITKERIHKAVKINKEFFLNIVTEKRLDGNNIPRLVNNFAILKTSWDVLSFFLFSDSDQETYSEYDYLYKENLKILFIENYDRVQTQNPEVKFEETLWDLIENKSSSMHEVGTNEYEDNKTIGYFYKRMENNQPHIKICLNMNKAYKTIDSYLNDQGGIGNSKETLISKLIQSGKIRTIPSGTMTLRADFQRRGVEWIGDFPKHLFGIEEPTLESITKSDEDFLF